MYCAWSDVKARLPNLPDKDDAPLELEDQVEAAILDAGTEIDGVLSALFSVPFGPVPPTVKSIAAYLASAFVLDGGWSAGADETNLGAHYRRLAQRRLDLVISGKLSLYPDESAPSDDPFGVEVEGEDGILSRFNPYAI